MNEEKHFLDMTEDEQQAQNEYDLREMKLYYGGDWNDLRKVIDRLEANDNERAWEKHNSDF